MNGAAGRTCGPVLLLCEREVGEQGDGGCLTAIGTALGEMLGLAAILIGIALVLAIYFAPVLVARQRRHRSLSALFVLNLLLGWTFLGWVAALVWALA